jgi:hypothetical protein
MPELKTGFGGDAFHWYIPGPPVECVYEIKGANGEWRAPKITDARKYGWYPGVTTIAGQEAKPGLVHWQVEQGILAALTHPRVHEITDAAELIAMLRADGEAQAKDARERGTRLHAAIERHFTDGSLDPEHTRHICGVRDALAALTGRDERELWQPELAACHPMGYGTRIDLLSRELHIIVDLKGKDLGLKYDRKAKCRVRETPETWAPEGYPEQARQLAACLAIMGWQDDGRCVNLFVARSHPGLVKAREWDRAELSKAWREFELLHKFWCVRNDFVVRT